MYSGLYGFYFLHHFFWNARVNLPSLDFPELKIFSSSRVEGWWWSGGRVPKTKNVPSQVDLKGSEWGVTITLTDQSIKI